MSGALALLLAGAAQSARTVEPFDIGLAADGGRIDALSVPAHGSGTRTAPSHRSSRA